MRVVLFKIFFALTALFLFILILFYFLNPKVFEEASLTKKETAPNPLSKNYNYRNEVNGVIVEKNNKTITLIADTHLLIVIKLNETTQYVKVLDESDRGTEESGQLADLEQDMRIKAAVYTKDKEINRENDILAVRVWY